MASKFHRGAVAYTQKGQRYIVDDVEEGVVYCSTESGAETEFSEPSLLTETEWTARLDSKKGLIYARLKQGRLYTMPPAKVDRAAAEQMLAKIERLKPGMLDFTAFTIAARTLAETGDADQAAELSIAKCRAIFDAAKPEIRASLLAAIIDAPPTALVGAGRLGDNLMRAMLDKGMAEHAAAFEEFGDRRRD
jgi:hypothetical protein